MSFSAFFSHTHMRTHTHTHACCHLQTRVLNEYSIINEYVSYKCTWKENVRIVAGSTDVLIMLSSYPRPLKWYFLFKHSLMSLSSVLKIPLYMLLTSFWGILPFVLPTLKKYLLSLYFIIFVVCRNILILYIILWIR